MNSYKDAEVFLTVPTGGFIISLRVTVLMFLEIIMTATVVVSIVIDVSQFSNIVLCI